MAVAAAICMKEDPVLRMMKTTPSRVAFVEQLVSTPSFGSPAIAAMMAWLCSTVCTLILLTSSAFCLHPPDVSHRMQSGTVLQL